MKIRDIPELNKKACKNSTPHDLSNLGLAETTQLNELFDGTYHWDWVIKNDAVWKATFKLADGSDIVVEIGNGGNRAVMVDFTRNGTYSVTGEGDAFKIFGTVMEIISAYIASEKPNTIQFSAEKNPIRGAKPNSRINLYSRMVKKFAGALGYDVNTSDAGHETKFKLIRKKTVTEDNDSTLMRGYKVMNYNPETGEVISGADSRVTKGMKVKPGMIMKMPHPGIFMSTNQDYVKTYYGGNNDYELLITFEFDPTAITTGNVTDRENEFTVPSARVVHTQIINNLDESTQLNELFNSTYPIKWDSAFGDLVTAQFKTDDGGTIDLAFQAATKDSPNFYFAFEKDMSSKRSGEGDQFKIFSTIIQSITDFLAKRPDAESIRFEAKRETNNVDTRDSRADLYKKLLSRYAKKNNYEFLWMDDPKGTEFMLRRRKNVSESNTENEIFIPDPKDTMGIKRRDMPQIHKDHYPELIKYLEEHGGKYVMRDVSAKSLRPIQAEFSEEGVRKMMGKGSVSGTTREKLLIVSSDNYIVDGHHRWLAAVNLDEPIGIMQFNIPIKRLFQLVKDFPYTTYKDIYEARYTAAEWACIQGGHSLTDLYEAFDQPYDYEWKKVDLGYEAQFETDSGSKVGVFFAPVSGPYFKAELKGNGVTADKIPPIDSAHKVYDIMFDRDGKFDVTGEGGAQRIFGTVIAIVKDFFKRVSPTQVSFSASKSGAGTSLSRTKLYKTFASMAARETGFIMHQFDLGREEIFYLHSPSIKENISHTGTERHKQEREQGLEPGSDAWFKHWFSRNKMVPRVVIDEAITYIKHKASKGHTKFGINERQK